MPGHENKEAPRRGASSFLRGASLPLYGAARQDTIGSLKASISPSYSLIGTQLQNTFLSP